MSWRTAELLKEAWLNLGSGLLRLAVFAGIVGLVLGALAFLELREAEDALSFQEEYVTAGGFVAVMPAPGAEVLPAGRCDALRSWPSVVAAGGLLRTEVVSFSSAPGSLFQRGNFTPGALDVWAPGNGISEASLAGGLVAGGALAKEFGLAAGGFAAFRDGPALKVAGVIDTERRNPAASRSALTVVSPADPVGECWVEFRQGTYRPGLASLGAWFTTGDEPLVARPYLRVDEFRRDPAAEFAARPQRQGWIAAAVVLAVMAWLMAWFRRAELGLYLALGTPRSAISFMLAIEAWLVVAPMAAAGLLYAFVMGRALDYDPGWNEVVIAARTSGLAALLAIALMPLGPLLVVRGSIAELLKDR